MQVQTQQASLLLDLVSKFLSKVLVNDRQYSYYLKQWTSFRQLLSTSPLNLAPIYSHLSDLGEQLSLPFKTEEHRPPKLHQYNLSFDINIKKDDEGLVKFPKFQGIEIASPISALTSTPEPVMKNFSSPLFSESASTRNSPEIKPFRIERGFPTRGDSTNLGRFASSPISDSFQTERYCKTANTTQRWLSPHPTRDHFHDSRSPQKLNERVIRFEESPAKQNPTPQVKHDLSFMVKRSKKMKDTMEANSNEMMSMFQSKKPKTTTKVVWQQRSELRKIKYYAKGHWL